MREYSELVLLCEQRTRCLRRIAIKRTTVQEKERREFRGEEDIRHVSITVFHVRHTKVDDGDEYDDRGVGVVVAHRRP